MSKSPPSTPFYWNDYFRDTRVLSPLARGIWMDMLCRLHESGRRGEITLPLASWLSWCSCSQESFEAAMQEISLTEVGTILVNGGTCPAIVAMSPGLVPVLVTVKSRRMMREEKTRQYEKLRKRAQRSPAPVPDAVPVEVHDSPPVPSSSSSSSSSDENPLNLPLRASGTAPPAEDEGQQPSGLARLSGELRGLFERKLTLVPDRPGEEGA